MGDSPDPQAPLAERLRPRHLNQIIGQDHLLGPDGPLRRLVERGALPSLILWGPPGCGKTTIARLLADAVEAEPVALSAVHSGVADLNRAFAAARARSARTVLFVDEVHRFTRTQQDALLPAVEAGTVTLIGATTENPSFALATALLSRCRVMVLEPLGAEALAALLARAEAALGAPLALTPSAREALLALADGDGRALIGLAEMVHLLAPEAPLTPEALATQVQRRGAAYDRDREGHYTLISALHKAIRGSDPDAALYYLARMVEGGEDPRFLARRLVRMASEDIGLADPDALPQALAAADAYERLGSPEGELALAQAAVYLATAPKSNAVYTAWKAALSTARSHGSLSPPKTILNAPTGLMKQMGYGHGYLYDHDQPDGFSGQDYWPEGLGRQHFYHPVERGFERDIARRLEWWEKRRQRRREG